YTFDDLPQEAGAVLEAAAVTAGARARAQELMAQIAVAVLDVDEVVAAVARAFRRDDVVVDEAAHLVVAHDGTIGGVAELPVEDGMPVGDPRLEFRVVVRLAEASRMRELQADDEAVVISGCLPVRLDQGLAQACDGRLRLIRQAELVWVGPTVEAD